MSMPAQKIRPAREQYDKMTDGFFKKRLQRKIKPQKDVLMERTLKKYDFEKQRQDQAAEKERQEMQERELEAKGQKRKAELNKLQRNAGFMDEWLEKGLKEWRTNILKKKQREKEDEKFKLRQAEMTLTVVQKVKSDATEETYKEIKDFEKRTQSPKKPSEEPAPADSDEDISLEPSSPKEIPKKTFAPKDSKYKQAQYNKEREQRRRKMLMDQGKMQRELEAKRREEDLVEKMNRLSRQEQELEYESWRTKQCKEVIVENRKLREARYHKREDLDTEVAIIREDEALTTLKGQLEWAQTIEQERAESYTVACKQYVRNANAIACQEFLNLVFDLADEAYKHQQTLDVGEIDSRNWREWTQLFVDKLPMGANSPATYDPAVNRDKALEVANARLDHLELLDYLASVHQWSRANTGTSADQKLINNFELGNTVRTLITLSYPPVPAPDLPKLALDVKLKLSIIGYAFGGKKTQARILSTKHGIDLISVEELIQAALKESEPTLPEDSPDSIPTKKDCLEEDPELKKLGLEIRQDLFRGKQVSDIVCVKLIMHKLQKLFGVYTKKEYYRKLKKERLDNKAKESSLQPEASAKPAEPSTLKKPEETHENPPTDMVVKGSDSKLPQKIKGFILVDYPSTLNQAKLLEQALNGYICLEDREVEIKEQLLSESAILAQPTPLPPPPKELIPSGLDAVLWLKTTKNECIKRAFGLKKDLKNDTIYHVLYNPPPTTNSDIVERLQTAANAELTNAILTDRHIAFDMAIAALEEWLKMFGDEKRSRCLLQEIEAVVNREEDKMEENAADKSVNRTHEMISNLVAKVLDANNEEEQTFAKKVAEETDLQEKITAAKVDFERRSMIFEEQLTRYIMRMEKKKVEEAAEAEKAEKLAKEVKKENKRDWKKGAKTTIVIPEETKKVEEEKKVEEDKKPEPPVMPEILVNLKSDTPKETSLVQIEEPFKRTLYLVIQYSRTARNVEKDKSLLC